MNWRGELESGRGRLTDELATRRARELVRQQYVHVRSAGMNVADLKLLVIVAQHRSFAGAARQLGLDPSVVSRTVAAVEANLGVRLFHRTTRKLSLTEAGARYCDRLGPLVEELARAQAEAQEDTVGSVGTLRVTASVAFGHTRLVPLLPALRKRYPRLALDLLLTDALLDLVAERVDLAIRLGPSTDTNLVGTRLAPTRHCVSASPEYVRRHGRPKSPADLAERDCPQASVPGHRSTWKFRDAKGRRSDVQISGSISTSNALALQGAALYGLGPVLLPDWLIGEDLKSGRLVDLFPDYEVSAANFDTGIWLLYVSRAYLPLKVRAVIDFLKSEIGRPGRSQQLSKGTGAARRRCRDQVTD